MLEYSGLQDGLGGLRTSLCGVEHGTGNVGAPENPGPTTVWPPGEVVWYVAGAFQVLVKQTIFSSAVCAHSLGLKNVRNIKKKKMFIVYIPVHCPKGNYTIS